YLPGVGPAAVAPPPDPATLPERRGRGQRLLVVDDDEVMVLMAQRLLERAGYRVTTAPGLAQALAAVAAAPAPFDLVISDYNMPEGSGLDLAEALQRERPGLPVVLSSGYLTDELAERAARIGVRGLLKKENSFEELTALVDAVLAPPPVA
ncbi:MAG: response regulator, partial [Burkholderiales bacterium]|nr:response regulator [Burkholderiales bacterium]